MDKNAYKEKIIEDLKASIRYDVNSGIEEAIFDNKVAVYPNPTSGDFKLSGAEGSKVIISDVLGREVLNIEKYDGQSVTLSQKGVYFLNIEGKQTQKLIVK